MDLGPEARRDLLHYAPGRVVGFHNRIAGGFRPGEKWTVRETNCETVTLESNGKVRQFKPSAKGKWDVLIPSTMQVSVGDQIRVTAGFREGKNVFKNNDIAEVREVTDTELALNDGRRMRRNGARIDQGICNTSHASQCRTVDQVVVLPTALTQKAGMSAYRGLGTRCTSTRVIRQRYVNRCCSLESASQCGSLSKLRTSRILSRDMQ